MTTTEVLLYVLAALVVGFNAVLVVVVLVGDLAARRKLRRRLISDCLRPLDRARALKGDGRWTL